MIKINLAAKKQAAAVAEAKGKGGGGGGFTLAGLKGGKVDLDQLKELPIKKIATVLGASFVLNMAMGMVQEDELGKAADEAKKVAEEKTKLEAELVKAKGYEQLKKAIEEDEFVIKTKIETIEKLVADRSTPPKMLVALSNAMPTDVWLVGFVHKDRELTVRGKSLGYNQISDLMKSLNETTYFADVSLKGSQQESEGGAGGATLAAFEITAKRK